MMAFYYMDVQTSGMHRGARMGATATAVISRAASVVHGIIRTHEITLALALPQLQVGERCHPGNVLRIFSRSPADLARCSESLAAHPVLRNYATLGEPTAVPSQHSGPWVEYRRFRIPGRSSRLTINRANRLRIGDELPYLRIASRSNGQPFSIRIQPLRHAGPIDAVPLGIPDSYGLSLPSRPIALPDLSVE